MYEKKHLSINIRLAALFWLLTCFLSAFVPAYAEEELTLYARSAVLIDGDSGRILYGKEPSEPLPMASTTKIMTCIVALEQAEGDLVCTVSANAAAQPEVKLGMVKGDTFYLKDLLHSLMLESHNDTAVCIAESVAGSVEGFASLMNEKAAQLGCTDTYFITPNGLDAEDGNGIHHTTAGELARILRYCITQSPRAQDFLAVTQTINYTFQNIAGTRLYSCVNHNAFLSMMEGALTGKTGFTSKAGYCYVGALLRGDRLYIVALLACGWPGHKSWKWADTRRLMDYGLANFEKRQITDTSCRTPDIPVTNGQSESVRTLVHQAPLELLMKKEEQITCRTSLPQSLAAPIQENQQVGTLTYSLNGTEFLTIPILAAETVPEIDYHYCLTQLLDRYLL